MSREEAISKAITIIAYFRQNFAKSQEAVKNANEIIEVLEQEPCEDCISRQAAIDAIEEDKRNGNDSCFASNYDAQCFKQIIKELPPVKPEQKMGRWVEHFDESGKWYECDQCHTDWGGAVNYCPNCGAKMEGEE